MATSISPPLSVSTPATSVASQAEPSIRFTGVKELVQTINNTSGDFLVVTDVSPSDFNEINLSREQLQPSRSFRLRRYDTETRILFITIPTRVHEKLHLLIYRNFEHQLVRKGIEANWTPIGATTFFPAGHPRGNGGEGDSAGGPIPARDAKDAWPTLVIEAGHSESLNQLRNDMRWWFSASDYQVKLVLLAKFDHGQASIFLEKWEEEPCATRLGATTTRRAAVPQPVLRQSITITKDATTNPASYAVTGGALVLPFRLLFLRDPGPQEGDIVIGVPELESYARMVWASV